MKNPSINSARRAWGRISRARLRRYMLTQDKRIKGLIYALLLERRRRP